MRILSCFDDEIMLNDNNSAALKKNAYRPADVTISFDKNRIYEEKCKSCFQKLSYSSVRNLI